MQIDPYQLYPFGEVLDKIHAFDWALSGIAWVAGLGHPTQSIVDVVCAFAPPVIAVLTLLFVFLIGRALLSPWAGIVAAAIAAVSPGEFLGRSMLGSADIHVAEALLVTVVAYLLVEALRDAGSYSPKWSVAAGVVFGLYFMTWVGAMSVGFAIAVYFAIQIISDHLRRQSVNAHAFTAATFFTAAAATVIPFQYQVTLYTAALIATAAFFLLLAEISAVAGKREWNRALFPVIVAGLPILAIVVARIASPGVFAGVASNFARLVPGNAGQSVSELQPLLSPSGTFTMSLAWNSFGPALIIGVAGMLIATVVCVWKNKPALLLVLLLGLFTMAMMLAERRYGYYHVVFLSLLGSYFLWLGVEGAYGLVKRCDRKLRVSGDKHRRRLRDTQQRSQTRVLLYAAVVAIMLVTAVTTLWSLNPALAITSNAVFGVTPGWQESLTWLKNNSPEPFASKEFYYADYGDAVIGTRYKFPDSAYAVTAWADYGYWITRIAHRIPNDNPAHLPQPDRSVFELLFAQDDAVVEDWEVKLRTRYVVLDYATVRLKLPAIMGYFREDPGKYMGTYRAVENGVNKTVVLFYPEFYRMFMTRLFMFDGKAVRPEGTVVIQYRVTPTGSAVTNAWKYESYEEAVRFVAANPDTRIVGTSPLVSPVPLDAVAGHKLVHEYKGGGVGDAVKVFEVMR